MILTRVSTSAALEQILPPWLLSWIWPWLWIWQEGGCPRLLSSWLWIWWIWPWIRCTEVTVDTAMVDTVARDLLMLDTAMVDTVDTAVDTEDMADTDTVDTVAREKLKLNQKPPP